MVKSATQKKPKTVTKATTANAETRLRGQSESGLVALTVRLPREQWKRLHALALDEGVSIQTLAVRGFDLVFAKKGMKELGPKS